MWSSCPVTGLLLKNRSSRARYERTAAKFPPADVPPTRKPFVKFAENFSGFEATYFRAAKQSSTAVGKGCSGARLMLKYEYSFVSNLDEDVPIFTVDNSDANVDTRDPQPVVVQITVTRNKS